MLHGRPTQGESDALQGESDALQREGAIPHGAWASDAACIGRAGDQEVSAARYYVAPFELKSGSTSAKRTFAASR
jgi:hypothetical protein